MDEKKKMTLTIFPVLKKTIFLYTVFFSLKKINCTFYLTNSCIFHRENIVVKILFPGSL